MVRVSVYFTENWSKALWKWKRWLNGSKRRRRRHGIAITNSSTHRDRLYRSITSPILRRRVAPSFIWLRIAESRMLNTKRCAACNIQSMHTVYLCHNPKMLHGRGGTNALERYISYASTWNLDRQAFERQQLLGNPWWWLFIRCRACNEMKP